MKTASPKDIAKKVVRRKDIHVEIPVDVHTEMRVQLFKRGNVSIQSVMSELAIRIANGDPWALDLVDSVRQRKNELEIESISRTEVDDLFNILEKVSPFETEEES